MQRRGGVSRLPLQGNSISCATRTTGVLGVNVAQLMNILDSTLSRSVPQTHWVTVKPPANQIGSQEITL